MSQDAVRPPSVLDAQERRLGRAIWIKEQPQVRQHRERYWIPPPIEVPAPGKRKGRAPKGLPPTRTQPGRRAKKIQIRGAAATAKKAADLAANLPSPRPTTIPPKNDDLLVQWILANAEIHYLDKNKLFRAPKNNPRYRGWRNDKANWNHVHAHAQMSATVLQKEKGRGGEGIAYLVQTTGPAAYRASEDEPRRKRYYIVKTVRNHSKMPIGFDIDGDPVKLSAWMEGASNDFRLFTSRLSGRVHPNICALEAFAGVSGTSIGLLFYEYADGGDLHSLVEQYFSRKDHVPEAFIWHVGAQLADAVRWLHSGQENPRVAFPGGHQFTSTLRDNLGRARSAPLDTAGDWQPMNVSGSLWTPMMHRDIKPANIFLSWRADDPNRLLYPDVKLGDFGFADEENRLYQSTAYYATVEYGPRDNFVSCAMDVWAVGAVIHVMAHAGLPPVRYRRADVRHRERRLAGLKPSKPLFREHGPVQHQDTPESGPEPEQEEVLPTIEENDAQIPPPAPAPAPDGNDQYAAYPGVLVSPQRYRKQTRLEWVDGNRHWLERAASAFGFDRWYTEGPENYEVHPLPSCYSQELDETVQWILNLNPRARPKARHVAEKFAKEALERIVIQYRPLADWYVHRPEPHQRSLPGFQLGGGRGRNLSEPAPEGPLGNMD